MKHKYSIANQSTNDGKIFFIQPLEIDLKLSSISFGFCTSLICAAILMPSSANAALDCTYNGSTITGGCSISNFGFGKTLNAGAGNISGNTITMTNGILNGSIMGGYVNISGTPVNGNTVIMQGGTVNRWVFGGWSNRGDTTNNSVVFGSISGSGNPSTNNGIIAGVSFGGGNAIGNSVELNSGNVNNYNIAGYAPRGNATGNSIVMNGGTITGIGYNVAGWATSGNVAGNSIVINGGTSKNSFAGFTNSGNATSNSIRMNGGTVSNLLAAGHSNSGLISDNTIIFNGGELTSTTTTPNLAAGFSNASATVMNNYVQIFGGDLKGGIVAGYSNTGEVMGNNIIVNDGVFDKAIVAGGYSNSGAVTNNITVINGGTFDNGSIISGGYSSTGAVTGNNVFLSGGTFNDDTTIAGGYSTGTGAVTGNTVTIDNAYSLTLNNVNLKGGVSTGGGIVADNRLVIKSAATVQNISDFEHLEFHIQDHNDIAMLTANSIDITATKNVEVYIADRLEMLRNGDTIKLLEATTDITGTANNIEITAAQGFHVLYDLEYQATTRAGRHLVVTGTRAHPHSRSFVEGRLGSFAFMNQGADLIVGQGISSALSASEASFGEWAGFTALSVGSSEYDTGGEANGLVDYRGLSMLIGLSKSIDLNKNDFLVGAFFEVGDGNIEARNSFSNGTEINTDGKSVYYGGGLLVRINNDSGLYGEGYMRVGTLDTDYTTDDIRFAVSHDTSSLYYGAGIGLGYTFKGFNEYHTIDLYGRYSWSTMEAEDVVIDSFDYNFDDINSHQARLGARYDYKDTKYISPYVGVAYAYEFDGEANAAIAGNLNITTPSLEGGTGIFEIGVKVISESNIPLSVNFDIEGYIGEREGVTGNIDIVYSF